MKENDLYYCITFVQHSGVEIQTLHLSLPEKQFIVFPVLVFILVFHM